MQNISYQAPLSRLLLLSILWVSSGSLTSMLITPYAVAEEPSTRNELLSTRDRLPAEATITAPDFQKHVSPLLGRLGCNGRSCHGSFQGQGGLRLSLFGYDFKTDHAALMASGSGRVDVEDIEESLILAKPIDADNHGGGKRLDVESWEYELLKNWIADGAVGSSEPQGLVRLEVQPAEIHFQTDGDSVDLKVLAHWADGSREDVTAFTRFQSNDPQIAEIDANGGVKSTGLGDTHVVAFYDQGVTPIPIIRAFPKRVPQIDSSLAIDDAAPIDRLVQQKLDKLNLQRSAVADDAMFLRRVSLDIAGTLPTPAEIQEFVADTSATKRQDKIESLLNTPAYAAWWTTFLCDLSGNNSQELRNLSYGSDIASQQWYDWILKRVSENVPYDQIVVGIVLSSSRSEGESYTEYCESMSAMAKSKSTISFVDRPDMPLYWMRRENQDRETRAIGFAQNFLGVQIQCAQCHKHPFDRWSQSDFEEFSRFFSGVSVVQSAASEQERAELRAIYEQLGMDPKVKGGNLQRAAREALQLGKTVPFAQLVVTRPKLTNAERKLIAEAAMAAAATAQDENTGQDAAKAKGKKKNRGNIRGPLYHTEGRLLGSEAISFAGVSDVRQLVSDWIRKEQNPYFARAFVNRVWARYFGVGIVNPIDDLNLANPPSNAELLDYLARGFVEHDYDMKWLHREIANSRTYQTSWVPNASNSLDQRNFSRAIPRRLPAELVVDALAFACAPDEMNNEFLSAVQDRSIAVPGTNGNSAKFAGRSAGYALQAFGRSTRNNNCDCDRSNETSLIQTVYLQNDQDVHFWLTHPKGWVAQKAMATESQDEVKVDQKRLETVNRRLAQLQRSAKNMKLQESNQALKKIISRIQQLTSQRDTIQQRIDESQESSSKVDVTDLITEAYLRTVGRFPTAVEVERCRIYIEESSSLMQGLTGVMWALINTKEFIVNH